MKVIDSLAIVKVINKMLSFLDPRLVGHGLQVAYIAEEIRKEAKDPSIDSRTLLFLSLLHDIGAYKTSEVDEMVSFDSPYVASHSVYGYLFLKYVSPLHEYASAVLYHHLDYRNFKKVDDPNLNYAALIHLADRIAVLTEQGFNDISIIQASKGSRFKEDYVDAFLRLDYEKIKENIKDGEYKEIVENYISSSDLSDSASFDFLRMMVYSLDFRSEFTIAHTIYTREVAVELAKLMGYEGGEIQKIAIGGLLHDVGKIATPFAILESPNRLSHEEMEIMKLHVTYTRKIIDGLVDNEIARIAYLHHEKLDGSGYPYGLKAEDLSIPEQIMAVADIASALLGKRSYKEAFSKNDVISIMSKMDAEKKINHEATRLFINHFDEVKKNSEILSAPTFKKYNEMHSSFPKEIAQLRPLLEN